MTLNSRGLSIASVGASKPVVKISSEGIQLTQTDAAVPQSLLVTAVNSSGGDITLVKPNTAGTSITHNLSGKSEAKTYTVTVPTTSWTSTTSGNSTIYKKTITVTGLTATDTPIVDVVLSDTVDTAKKELQAYGCISRITTAANSITIYCYESAPTTQFTIQLLNVTNRQ